MKCEEGTAAATLPAGRFGMVGLPTEQGSCFLHTPTTRYYNSFYKQMADARLESRVFRVKQTIAGARDSQPLLAGFEKAQGEQQVRLQLSEWLQRKPKP